jgi:TRAP-type C4-dicarboxylate transport system permease small subunit
MGKLRAINQVLMKLEQVTGIILLFALFILLTVNIILRYFFNQPIAWAEELSNFLLIWIGFLASSYTLAAAEHISFSLILHKMPKKVRVYTTIGIYFIILILVLTFIPSSFRVYEYFRMTPALNLYEGYFFAIIPLVLILMAYHLSVHILNIITHGSERGEEGQA